MEATMHEAQGVGLAANQIGIARNLAIIDLNPTGAQPMTTEDGRYTIVYNGEVFNAGELRDDLAARGHRFRTRCDTEVVLRGYAQ